MLFHVVVFLFVLYQIVRFLRSFDKVTAPKLHHSDSGFIKDIIAKCPVLEKPYVPVSFWGKCGHIQTMFYGKIGRHNAPYMDHGKRRIVVLKNGDTVTYDMYEALIEHRYEGDYTILLCPGIATHSEKAYIRMFIKYAVEHGFRIAVLNHIGSLMDVKLTTPRIFTYGDTQYFAAMSKSMMEEYTNSTFAAVGYSMGGNIVTKWLGEDWRNQKNILCAVSLCQGYDGIRSTIPLDFGYRRFYNLMITLNMKKIIRSHWNELFQSSESKFDQEKIKSAVLLKDIEEGLLRHFDGFASRQDYMDKASCCHVIHNVKTPMLFFNTRDDPLIINDVHDVPINHCEKNENSLFVTTDFGGHLGCFRGSWYKPDALTLIEEMIVEYINAVIETKLL